MSLQLFLQDVLLEREGVVFTCGADYSQGQQRVDNVRRVYVSLFGDVVDR